MPRVSQKCRCLWWQSSKRQQETSSGALAPGDLRTLHASMSQLCPLCSLARKDTSTELVPEHFCSSGLYLGSVHTSHQKRRRRNEVQICMPAALSCGVQVPLDSTVPLKGPLFWVLVTLSSPVPQGQRTVASPGYCSLGLLLTPGVYDDSLRDRSDPKAV